MEMDVFDLLDPEVGLLAGIAVIMYGIISMMESRGK